MGLEIVELIMRTEEEFDLKIENVEAERAETVCDLYNLVLEKLHQSSTGVDGEAVWEKLRAMIADEFCIAPEQITPQSYFVHDLGLD